MKLLDLHIKIIVILLLLLFVYYYLEIASLVAHTSL